MEVVVVYGNTYLAPEIDFDLSQCCSTEIVSRPQMTTRSSSLGFQDLFLESRRFTLITPDRSPYIEACTNIVAASPVPLSTPAS